MKIVSNMVLVCIYIAVCSATQFDPTLSSTFYAVRGNGNINVTFLDGTNLVGYDGSDAISIGGFTVESRFCLIHKLASHDFAQSDGILGFGASRMKRTASILRTLSRRSRPGWSITRESYLSLVSTTDTRVAEAPGFQPMREVFAFTADDTAGELQLGGYDPSTVFGETRWVPMIGPQYGVNVTSVKFGDVELLRWSPAYVKANDKAVSSSLEPPPPPATVAVLDSGTTCTLLPNSTMDGILSVSPFQLLQAEYDSGKRFPLVFTIDGHEYSVDGCVDPFGTSLIMGDPWFRRFVVIHDMEDWEHRKIGLGLRDPAYVVGQDIGHPNKLMASRKLHDVALSRAVLTYNIPVGIGTPPQAFNLIFDTGSYLLAVFSAPPPPTGPFVSVAQSMIFVSTSTPYASRMLKFVANISQATAAVLVGVATIALIGAAVMLQHRVRGRQLQYERIPDTFELACTSTSTSVV